MGRCGSINGAIFGIKKCTKLWYDPYVEYKAFTTRLPMQVCEAMTSYVADRKSGSVNQFVLEAVEEKLARVREDELRLMFEDIAEGFDMEEVEPFLAGQREAMKHVDN